MKVVCELVKEKGSSCGDIGKPVEVIYRRRRIPVHKESQAEYGDLVAQYAKLGVKTLIIVPDPRPRSQSHFVFIEQ